MRVVFLAFEENGGSNQEIPSAEFPDFCSSEQVFEIERHRRYERRTRPVLPASYPSIFGGTGPLPPTGTSETSRATLTFVHVS